VDCQRRAAFYPAGLIVSFQIAALSESTVVVSTCCTRCCETCCRRCFAMQQADVLFLCVVSCFPTATYGVLGLSFAMLIQPPAALK